MGVGSNAIASIQCSQYVYTRCRPSGVSGKLETMTRFRYKMRVGSGQEVVKEIVIDSLG